MIHPYFALTDSFLSKVLSTHSNFLFSESLTTLTTLNFPMLKTLNFQTLSKNFNNHSTCKLLHLKTKSFNNHSNNLNLNFKFSRLRNTCLLRARSSAWLELWSYKIFSSKENNSRHCLEIFKTFGFEKVCEKNGICLTANSKSKPFNEENGWRAPRVGGSNPPAPKKPTQKGS